MSYPGHQPRNTQITYALPLSRIGAKFLLVRNSTLEGDTSFMIVRGSRYRASLLQTLFNQCQFIKPAPAEKMVFIPGKWYNDERAELRHVSANGSERSIMFQGDPAYCFGGVTYSVIERDELSSADYVVMKEGDFTLNILSDGDHIS